MIFDPLDSGTSLDGNEIQAFKTNVSGPKYLYLLAGTHGDEVEGVYVCNQLMKWLKEDHQVTDLPIIAVPILNVDGYRAMSRVNARGVDLNRNYPASNWAASNKKDENYPGTAPTSEPENKFLLGLFSKFTPGFVLSLHSWKPILNYNGDAKDVADFLSSFNNYPVADDIGYPCPGSLGTYVPETYQAGVLTYEFPLLKSGMSLKEIWEQNERGLKELLKSELLSNKL